MVNGEHIILKCKECEKPLVDIWITNPDRIDPITKKVFENKIQAECCYCGNTSYITTVKGGFHIGGYGEDTNDANYAVEKTSISITSIPEKPNVTYIKTRPFGTV